MTLPPERPRTPRLAERQSLARSLLDSALSAAPLARVPGMRPTAITSRLPKRLEALIRPSPRRVPRRKGALLWVLPLPLLLASMISLGAGRFDHFMAEASGFGLFMTAAWLTRRGIRDDYAPPQTRFVRRGRWPWKALGGALTALAAGLTAGFAVGHGLAISLAFAVVAGIGFQLAYRVEPLGAQPALNGGDESTRRVAEALAEAEDRLLDLERTAATMANPELKARLERLGAQGRGILEQIAERPTDLYRARKFLNVYLEGIQQVAEGYARTHRRADSLELEQNFRTVLMTVEEVFEEQRQRLLESDVLDLDIQIEVLKKQLEREGIA